MNGWDGMGLEVVKGDKGSCCKVGRCVLRY